MADITELILNRKHDSPHMVHRADCASIQHQVRGDVSWEGPLRGFRVIEKYPDGTTLIDENGEWETQHYEAVYITADDLKNVGRYRRCRICLPDVPEGPAPAVPTVSKSVATLTLRDLGRVSEHGTIRAVSHSDTGVSVRFDHDEILFSADERIGFPRRQSPGAPT